MNINKITVLILCILSQSVVIAEEKKVDPEAKQQAALLRKMFSKEGLFGGTKPSANPVADIIDNEPLPENVNNDTVKKALAVFAKTFFLSKVPSLTSDDAKIEFDKFILPNNQYTDITTEWRSVKSKKGHEVIGKIKKKDSSPAQFILFAKDYSFIPLAKKLSDEEPLSKATGKATVKIPIEFLRLDVSSSDLEKAVAKDGYEVILQELKNDYVRVQINGKNDFDKNNSGIVVIPMGKNGRLKVADKTEMYGSIQMPEFVTKIIEDLESGKKTVKEAATEFSEGLKKPRTVGKQNERIILIKSAGTINNLAVFIPKKFANKTINVVAATGPELNLKKPKTLQINRFLNKKIHFQDLTLDELKNMVKCKSNRSAALMEYNTPGVVCELPKISNSEYASIEYKNPILSDKANKPVPFDLQEGVYESENQSLEIRFVDKKNSDSVISFEKAVGTVHFRYPLKIKTLRIKKSDAHQSDIVIDGYFVKYNDNKVIQTSAFSEIKPVRAFDSQGRQFLQMGGYTLTYSGLTPMPFWGYPDMVEMDTEAEWVEFDLKYELAPAELLEQPRMF